MLDSRLVYGQSAFLGTCQNQSRIIHGKPYGTVYHCIHHHLMIAQRNRKACIRRTYTLFVIYSVSLLFSISKFNSLFHGHSIQCIQCREAISNPINYYNSCACELKLLLLQLPYSCCSCLKIQKTESASVSLPNYPAHLIRLWVC